MVLVTTTLWSLVFAVSYEFARTFKVYDYRSFFKELLGPGWVLYEVCYIVLLLIVLGVVGATSGTYLCNPSVSRPWWVRDSSSQASPP